MGAGAARGVWSQRRAAIRGLVLAVACVACAAAVAVLVRLPDLPGEEKAVAAFSTSLSGRTRSQVHNVQLALMALNGTLIRPGEEFSFNRTVGPWTVDRGYRRAPVSYSGEMVRDWGGGVCQASTTLYNAALLAGLPVLERHRHHWPATYVPPGRDAAVAYPSIDLRFRNSLASPIRITARVAGESVVVRLHSRERPPQVRVEREIMAVAQPATVMCLGPSPTGRAPNRGQAGCEVAVYRVWRGAGERWEFVSRDTYPPQNRLVWR
ncbi:MAG: VanW family protein [Armatimonadota bacterium]|nr:MAG: VanW family protein [Armatimonadota bacterium]